MKKELSLKRLIDEYIYFDCRLGSHPRVQTRIFWKNKKQLIPLMSQSSNDKDHLRRLHWYVGEDKVKEILTTKGGIKCINTETVTFSLGIHKYRSLLAYPLVDVRKTVGLLVLESFEKEYFKTKPIGPTQLLAALLVCSQTETEFIQRSLALIILGQGLKQVREEIGLTQEEIADSVKQNTLAISQWESGKQPLTRSTLYQWCKALGLLSPGSGALVTFVDITPKLLRLLKDDPTYLRELSPSQFERFVAERLDRMGYDVNLTGATSQRDGGIDLVAVPKAKTVGSFLIAGQVKHHREMLKTGRDAVDRLLAWKNSYFQLGLLVTNTEFTKDARWVAAQDTNRAFIRLRDFIDLKRWIEGNFRSEEDWREIPDEIELAPSVTIAIPKPRLTNSQDLWPISKLEVG